VLAKRVHIVVGASRLHELLVFQFFVEDMLFVLFVLFLAECHRAMTHAHSVPFAGAVFL
jgi:hypothetical protein